MGDFVGVQFGSDYDQQQANTLVDILERTFSNISTVFARAKRAAYQSYSNTTPVGNINAGVDTLITYTLPANVLALDGYSLELKAWGTFAANGNNKELKMLFGSAVLYDTGVVAVNDGTWMLNATIVRTGAATQQAITTMTSSNATVANSVTYLVPTETLSGTIVIKCTGEAIATNDIIQKGFLLKIIPQEQRQFIIWGDSEWVVF